MHAFSPAYDTESYLMAVTQANLEAAHLYHLKDRRRSGFPVRRLLQQNRETPCQDAITLCFSVFIYLLVWILIWLLVKIAPGDVQVCTYGLEVVMHLLSEISPGQALPWAELQAAPAPKSMNYTLVHRLPGLKIW